MAGQQSFAIFAEESREFYDSLTSVPDVVGFWEQVSYIADFGDIGGDLIREADTEIGPAKLIVGPRFLIIFDNDADGSVLIYHIRRPSFLRPR